MNWRTVFMALMLVFLPLAAEADSCSCSAPNGACSASISCSGGCYALCPNSGGCTAQCSGSGPRTPYTPGASSVSTTPAGGHESLSSWPLPKSIASRLIQLDVQAATAAELSEEVSALAHTPIRFIPASQDETLTLQLKQFPLGDLLSLLASRGAVVVDGRSYDAALHAKAPSDRRVTLQAHQVNETELARILSDVLGREVEVKPGAPGVLYDFQAKDMPVEELVQHLAHLGKVVLRD